MTLKVNYIRTPSGWNTKVMLVKCPACGAEFPPGPGSKRPSHFLNDHDPEDFGLSPVGETGNEPQ